MIDEFELLRDYIDVLIWPLAIFGIVVLATDRFRVQIAALIDRIQILRGPGGSAIHAPLGEQKTEDVEQPPDPPPEAAAVKPSSEKEVEESLQVKRELANTQWALYYERVYRVLWGSQISLLQALNEHPDGVTITEVILTYLDRHNKAGQLFNPSYKNTLTPFMAFLSREGLVQFGQANNYVITELGRGFLAYLVLWDLPLAKAY